MNQRPAPQSNTRRGQAPQARSGLLRGQLTRRPTAGTSAPDAVLDTDAGDTSEIVVRNQQGEIELGDPPTPVIEDDDEAEQVIDRHESEKERQRLAEAVKHHSINHSTMSSQGEELLEVVRASLRAKVTALADDNWMFEPDEPTR